MKIHPLMFACALTCSTLPMLTATPAPAAAPAPTQKITLRFAAAVNGAPFRCDKTYTGVGTKASTLIPHDFRFYVSRLRLLKAKDGQEVPLQLIQDGKWQYQNLALLDFENQTGSCEGNPDTHTEVTGTVPAGDYQGLRFDLGVPFDLNHQDVNLAPSPLNLTSLFWVWRSGYKFARLDFASKGQPQGYFIHLGSTGCGEANPNTPEGARISRSAPLSCSRPNRPAVELKGFQPARQTVVADLGKLLSSSNIDANQPQTAAGCMSGADDGDCEAIFKHFGIDFHSARLGGQDFFSAQ